MAKERDDRKGFIDRHPVVSLLAVVGTFEFMRRLRKSLREDPPGCFLGPDGRLHERHPQRPKGNLGHERAGIPETPVRRDISASTGPKGDEHTYRAEPHESGFYRSSSLFGPEGLSGFMKRTEGK